MAQVSALEEGNRHAETIAINSSRACPMPFFVMGFIRSGRGRWKGDGGNFDAEDPAQNKAYQLLGNADGLAQQLANVSASLRHLTLN